MHYKKYNLISLDYIEKGKQREKEKGRRKERDSSFPTLYPLQSSTLGREKRERKMRRKEKES